jgi:hypothetical protein
MTITLNDTEVQTLLKNMMADEAQVRMLALLESPGQAEFADEDGEQFSHYTVYRLWEAARALKFNCYSCGQSHGISEWSGDSSNLDLCVVCLNEAELENEHSDYGHDTPVADCPSCPKVGV